jgi:hypothetical protein
VHRRLTDNIGAFVEHLEAVLSELAQDDDAD